MIIGDKVARELFKNKNPIGQTVSINNVNFTIIGVTAKIDSFFWNDPNTDSFVPYTKLRKVLRKEMPTRFLSEIMLSTTSLDEGPMVTNRITKILRARHNLKPGEPNDFTIFNQQSMAKAAQASSSVLTLLLAIIAAISLLVGGIGVMNIMLVTVQERTREIGIRLAIGASQRKILQQFLIEALMLCFIGGIIGLLLGLATPYVVSKFTNWIVIINPISTILAFCTIFIIGLVFGYYPARKASQLNPVEALQEN